MQDTEIAKRGSFANFQNKLATKAGLVEADEQAEAGDGSRYATLVASMHGTFIFVCSFYAVCAVCSQLDIRSHIHLCVLVDPPQQPQQEAKKSRFSLNFLRASLLSPKGSSAAKGSSIFSTATELKSAVQSPAIASEGPGSHSSSGSPFRQQSADQSAASAQHWSPLGHGASAFSDSPAVPDDQAEATSSAPASCPDYGNLADHGARSPLRALSSNSPTRLQNQSKHGAQDAVSNKGHPVSGQPDHPAVTTCQQRGHSDEDASAPTMILGAAPLQQHSLLPANALVAYSSDEDDWHNADDATERELAR